MEELKNELIEIILKLSDSDYESFCMNYNIYEGIERGRDMLEFIQDLEEEDIKEVISEIHINVEIEY